MKGTNLGDGKVVGGRWALVRRVGTWLSMFPGMLLVVVMAAEARAAVQLDSAQLSAWADGLFETAFSEHRFSGAAIAVVENGEVVLARGYGYADLGARVPIDLESTRFQIASVTKTFTAVAVAQLLERGIIRSLDDPVNDYLGRVRIPRAFGKEVTVRDLLTHRAGFEDIAWAGFSTRLDNGAPVTGEEIERLMPRIVREPGTLAVYSNFGVGLLGIMIEDLTGMPLAQYFEQSVFSPLQMRNSLLASGEQKQPGLARPYGFFPNGELKRSRPVGGHPLFAAAGDIEASVMDMSRYMRALLDCDTGGSASLLAPESCRQLFARHAGNHDQIHGLGLAFSVGNWNGERIVSHGGHLPGYMSDMILLPDSDIGMFVVVMIGDASITLGERLLGHFRPNRHTPAAGIDIQRPLSQLDVTSMFLQRFLGPLQPPQGSPSGRIDDYVGQYRSERRSHTQFEKSLQLLNPAAGVTTVARGDDNTLVVNGSGPYVEVADGVFWLEGGGPDIGKPLRSVFESPVVAFIRDASGKVTHVNSLHNTGVSAVVNQGPQPATLRKAALLGFYLAMLGVFALLWQSGPGLPAIGRNIALVIPALLLMLPAVLYLGFGPHDNLVLDLYFERFWRFGVVIAVANMVTLLGLASLVFQFLAWKRRYWGEGVAGVVFRVQHAVMTVGVLLMVPAFWYGNLLGLNL